MNEKIVDFLSYRVHMVKTTKFKTILFQVLFRDEIRKEDITKRNLLTDHLIHSSLKYKTKKEFNLKKQELYGASLGASNKRIGNQIITEFTMSILNPRYTEDNMLEESLEFFHEILFNPNVKNGKFQKETFETLKNALALDIKMDYENPTYYASLRMLEELKKDTCFSYHLSGYLDDLEQLNEETLYKYYKNMFATNLIDIYVIGDFSFDEMENLIKKYFPFKTIKKPKKDFKINKIKQFKTTKKVVEESKFHQSKLAIAGILPELEKFEENYVLSIYNILLGNSPESKFFLNIREKCSYAYSIYSTYRKFDRLFLIFAGISKENYEDVIKKITYEMNEVVKGEIKEESIKQAKAYFISVLKDIFDSPASTLEYYFAMDYLNTDPFDIQVSNIEKITKKDIIKLASKISLDMIYLLKEKEHENNINC